MKHLKYLILILAGLYLVTFGFVIIDVSDSRPLVSLFKKFQSDSALKVVDFSIDKGAITKTKPTPISKKPLSYNEDTNELICKESGLAYPIKDGIPVMLPEEARKI